MLCHFAPCHSIAHLLHFSLCCCFGHYFVSPGWVFLCGAALVTALYIALQHFSSCHGIATPLQVMLRHFSLYHSIGNCVSSHGIAFFFVLGYWQLHCKLHHIFCLPWFCMSWCGSGNASCHCTLQQMLHIAAGAMDAAVSLVWWWCSGWLEKCCGSSNNIVGDFVMASEFACGGDACCHCLQNCCTCLQSEIATLPGSMWKLCGSIAVVAANIMQWQLWQSCLLGGHGGKKE